MTEFLKTLRDQVRGDVLTDDTIRDRYSRAEGIFELVPQAVVIPTAVDDIVAVVKHCTDAGVPLTARGGGTGVAGQAIGTGVVLDLAPHFGRILSIDTAAGIAHVQPGVVLARLQEELTGTGWEVGPDPQSWDRCTLGGMVSTNAAGPHSLRHGATVDAVDELQMVGAGGELFVARATAKEELPANAAAWERSREQLFDLLMSHEEEILQHPLYRVKNSSGYLLKACLPRKNQFPWQRIFCGAEGTLGIVTSIKLKLVRAPRFEGMLVVGLSGRQHLGNAVMALRSPGPAAIEYLDRTVLKLLRESGEEIPDVARDADGLLIVLFEADSKDELERLAGELERATSSADPQVTTVRSENFQEREMYLGLRQRTSPILARMTEGRRNLRLIEDAAVPPSRLGEFADAIEKFLGTRGITYVAFGHAGDGHLHVNVFLDPDDPGDRALMQEVRSEYPKLVRSMDGTPSGEHGDGLLRTPVLREAWGELYPVFEEVKRIFDPAGIFNPGRIVSDDTTSLEDAPLRSVWK